MHPRLPLIAGVPGRLSAVALTTALLATGCAPNFHSPEPSSMVQVRFTQPAPAAAQDSAESTMSEAAVELADRISETHAAAAHTPDGGTAAVAGEVTAEEPVEEAGAEPSTTTGSSDTPGTQTPIPTAPPEGVTELAADLNAAHEASNGPSEGEEADAEDSEDDSPADESDEATDPEEDDDGDSSSEDTTRDEADEPEDEGTADEGESADIGPDEEPELGESLELEDPTDPAPPVQSTAPSFDGDLNTYLAALASNYPGQISINVAELGADGRHGSTGGGDSHRSASTYKILVAHSVLQRIDDGSMSWDDPVIGERDLAQCFHDMIALSDNPCPEKLGPEIGWATIYSEAAPLGVTNTRGGEGGILTTADDLSSFMTSLATGSMSITDSSQQRLRDALAANIHRQGISAGSTGQVLNKPGWISGNLHDTAIVHHPSGSYVLTILSQGSSWETIAAITRDIETALGYQ